MNLFGKHSFNNLEDLLHEQIADLYDAERRLCDALPKMASAASSPQLKDAFNSHLSETKTQVQRLESVFELLGKKPERETCDAMRGLISEGEEMVEAKGDASVRDVGAAAFAGG